jgi:outer membrane protein assembly factor BamE
MQVKNTGTLNLMPSLQKLISKFISPLLTALLILQIQACSFPGVFKINVQQGNIINTEMLETLKPGMTKKQVHFVLGKPVLDNLFNDDLENYVYTYQKAGGEIAQQTIKIFYKDDIFERYEGTLLEENPAY